MSDEFDKYYKKAVRQNKSTAFTLGDFYFSILIRDAWDAGRLSTSSPAVEGEPMTKTTIYAYVDRDTAWEKGEKLGLKGEALRMFSHFNEIKLEIEIDEDGVITKTTAINT